MLERLRCLVVVATTGTASALTTLATRTTRALLVAFRFRLQHTVGELVLARLRVDLHQLHLDLVALVETSVLNGVQTVPVDL